MINNINIFSCELFGFGKNKKEETNEKVERLPKEKVVNYCKLAVDIVKIAFKKHGQPKGFSIVSSDDISESIDDYLENGYSIILARYDAWKFTNNKARDEHEYAKFNNMLVDIENTIKDLIKEKNFPYNITSDGGDWDDGSYNLEFTKPNLNHIKNYM